MNSQQVKIVLMVAACKNFSRAAEQLYLSQSVASYHVRALEKELGFSLFARSTHGVALTPAGEAFCKALAALEAQYRDALAQARKIAQGERPPLSICFGTPTSPTVMGQIVNQICGALSLEEVGLTKRSEGEVLQPVLSGAADLLFIYPPFFRPQLGLGQRPFCMTWACCLMRPQHPLAGCTELTLEALRGQTLFLVDSKNAQIEHRAIYERLRESGGNGPELDSTPKTFDQAQGLALAGRGMMLVRTLEPVCQPNIDGLVGVPVRDIEPMPLLAVWREKDLCPLGKRLLEKLPPPACAL